MVVNSRIRNAISNTRIFNTMPNSRVSSFQTAGSQGNTGSVVAGSLMGILGLTYAVSSAASTTPFTGQFRPNIRIVTK